MVYVLSHSVMVIRCIMGRRGLMRGWQVTSAAAVNSEMYALVHLTTVDNRISQSYFACYPIPYGRPNIQYPRTHRSIPTRYPSTTIEENPDPNTMLSVVVYSAKLFRIG